MVGPHNFPNSVLGDDRIDEKQDDILLLLGKLSDLLESLE